MRAGEAVIPQAALGHGVWRGYADFLERVERPSALGEFAYEPTSPRMRSWPARSYDAAPEPKRIYVFERVGHNDLVSGAAEK
jgi:hypothetical protein